jgi:hypothetical protein
MLAHGFSIELLVVPVRTGFATARAECMVAGGKSIEVARARTSEGGWRSL